MAGQRELDFTYTLTDRLFRLSIGETGDFSGAKYDGNWSLTLEHAQRRKHDFVWEQLGLVPGQRLIDLGCGWGGLLHYLKGRGVAGVGLTLSRGQYAACRRHGLDVHFADCRTITRERFGAFDAAASLGAFEHFCSPAEFRAGRQDAIYARFFRGRRMSCRRAGVSTSRLWCSDATRFRWMRSMCAPRVARMPG